MNKLEAFVKSTEGETRQVLEDLVHHLADSIKQKRHLEQQVDNYKSEIRLLRKHIYGSRSDKVEYSSLSQEDLEIFNEFELVAQEAESSSLSDVELPLLPKKKSGRKPLPAHLPRVIVEHDLTEAEKVCSCGNTMKMIGVQTSEELEYIPAQLKVLEHHCKKYLCARCVGNDGEQGEGKTSKIAKKPPQLIEKSFASPTLLAHIAVSKFCDHLPLYRQEDILKRLSIDLPRQTMATWMIKVGEAITPIINLMHDTIIDYDVAYADETTVQILEEPNRRAQSKSYMWCFIGGPPDRKSIIYQYDPTRSGKVPVEFFEGFKGAIHCDGYAGYNSLFKPDQIRGINCFAHVRRKFVEALPQGQEKGVAGTVVKMIRLLYHIEAKLKAQEADYQTIYAVRQKKAAPILEKLKAYLDEKARVTLPSSRVGKAINYTLNRWRYLINYLEDGRYEIDNNQSERAIKPFVCGRKNWLFAKSVEGINASANIYSLIVTAKVHGLNPFAYLTYLFEELPKCRKVEDYELLLPFNIKDPHLKTCS